MAPTESSDSQQGLQSLTKHIEAVSDVVAALVAARDSSLKALTTQFPESTMEPYKTQLDEIVSQLPAPTEDKAPNMKETVLSGGFTQAVYTIFQRGWLGDKPDSDTALAEFAVVLDFIISLSESYSEAKRVFYDTLGWIVRELLPVRGQALDQFWDYMESRQQKIVEKMCNASIVSDRINMLELCNLLTDYYRDYHGGSSNRPAADPRRADAVRDRLRMRVRQFVSEVLSFEDSTGLNKYFTVAGRKVAEMPKGDHLFEDLYQLQQMFNHHYATFGRNPGHINDNLKVLRRIFFYIAPKISWSAFSRSEEPEKEEATTETVENSIPDSMWDIYGGPKADTQGLKRWMTRPLAKLTWVCQTFIITNFYVEAAKDGSLKTIAKYDMNADSLKQFTKFRDDLIAEISKSDEDMGKLLKQLGLGEQTWWKWLINGKDADGKPVIGGTPLTAEEVEAASEEAAKAYPLKNKLYFNTYITPQVTRKMRTATGIERINEGTTDVDMEDAARLETLQAEVAAGDYSHLDERNTLLWKSLRKQRNGEWLSLTGILAKEKLVENPLDFNAESEDEEEEKSNDKEGKKEEKDEAKNAETKADGGAVSSEANGNGKSASREDTPMEDTPQVGKTDRDETPRENTPREETPREDTAPVEDIGDDYSRETNDRDETPHTEDTPQAEETQANDTPREDTPREDTPREDTPREDTPREDTPREEEQEASPDVEMRDETPLSPDDHKESPRAETQSPREDRETPIEDRDETQSPRDREEARSPREDRDETPLDDSPHSAQSTPRAKDDYDDYSDCRSTSPSALPSREDTRSPAANDDQNTSSVAATPEPDTRKRSHGLIESDSDSDEPLRKRVAQ
ncbi:hypothetical protein DICA1_D10352 [Diutina catenulata]